MKNWIAILLILKVLAPAALHAQISDPTEIGDLVFWADANDVNGTGAQPADGAVVTTWADKSGNGNDLTTAAGTVTFEAAGFDGTNPGLRFPVVARMAGPSPFAANYQDEITVFFVNANVTSTANFSVNLNGTTTSSNATNGRFSFHTPWTNSRIYFDAGACCGATRLQGVSPNGLTETTLYTGLNDQPGSRQWLRIDGAAFESDSSAISARVSGGIHLGDLPSGHTYNGRFAEVVIYDRALSLTETEEVECYLMLKWKPADAPATCLPNVTVTKDSTAQNTLGLGAFALPGNDIRYDIVMTKSAGPALTGDSIFLVDSLPSDFTFYNDDFDGPGPETNPIGFSQSGGALTFNYGTDVRFSDLAVAPTVFGDCNYSPSIGYDPNVRHICVNPKGNLPYSLTDVSFNIFFRGRIE